MILKDEVEKIANLARLELGPKEVAAAEGHFNKIIQYFDSLSKVSTQGVLPMVTPHDIFPPLRVDKVEQNLSVDEIMQNAPDVKDSLFKVPPVV